MNAKSIMCLVAACGAAASADPLMITGSGATLQETFFRSAASTNDFIDYDNDGRAGSLAESTTSYRKYIPPVAGILLALSIGGAVLGGWWAAILLPVLLVLFALPAGAVMVPMLMLWNQQSRIEQTESLWGLVGKVFTPLALPEGEEPDPFR